MPRAMTPPMTTARQKAQKMIPAAPGCASVGATAVEGADPGAEAHLHLDVAGAHAADGVDREQQGEAQGGAGQAGADAAVAGGLGEQSEGVQQAQQPSR